MSKQIGAPHVAVSIGCETRLYHAFVTTLPIHLDASLTMTLCSSTLREVGVLAASDATFGQEAARLPARLVLVDARQLPWQRARCRESHRMMTPADPELFRTRTLQAWLWRRLRHSVA